MQIGLCFDQKEYQNKCIDELENLSKSDNYSFVISCFQNGKELFEKINSTASIDLLYIDVNFECGSGFEIVEKIRTMKCKCEIIFYTSEKTKWPEAFGVGAIQYLIIKEMESRYFKTSFDRALSRIEQRQDERIILSCANETRNLSIREIMYFEVNRNIVTVHYSEVESFEFYTPLTKIEKSLSKYGFLKCHQSYLVSLKYIHSLKKKSLFLTNGAELPLSRTYKKVLEDKIKSIMAEDMRYEE